MITLTKKQIQNIKPLTNRVLIKTDRKADEIKLGKNKIYFDPSYHLEQNAPSTGEIVAVCQNITLTSPMSWIPQRRLEKIGDTAYFSYTSSMDNLPDINTKGNVKNPVICDEEGNVFYWVTYHDIYCLKRQEIIIPINHYHLCQPIHANIKTNIELPDLLKNKNSKKIAKVIISPEIPVTYNNKINLSTGGIAQKNQYIIFDKHSDINVEYDIHRSLMEKKQILAIAQRDVLAIITDNSIIELIEEI